MEMSRRTLVLSLVIGSILILVPVTAKAGSHFGLHIGSGGFGVSVGVGDWAPYTNAWSNPQWSLSFNTSLAGYGEWVWVEGLGRCWRPWVAPGWQPYTYGRWVRTGVSLTWVAYEPWGYVPHHYGNWAHATYGWVWVPGYAYVSANVTWVRGGTYVGWYARPPHGWSHAAKGFHHGYQHGYRDGWKDARYGTYVGWQHFGSDNISHHAVGHTSASKTRLAHGGTVPTADELWRNGRSRVTETSVSTRTVRMDGREVTIARPEGVATSIERHASGTVQEALSESARRQRQPRATSQRSGVSHRSRSQSGETNTAVSRSQASESHSSSPSRFGQRSVATGSTSRTSSRSLQSPSSSRTTGPSPDRSRASRTVTGTKVDTRTRKIVSAPAASSRGPRTAVRSAAPPARPAIETAPGERSSKRKRSAPSISRPRQTEADQSSTRSTQKGSRRRTVPEKR